MQVALTLSIVYAANIGGVGILTGTGPNLVMKQYIDQWYKSKGYEESPINFASWLTYGLPIAIINLVILWAWFLILYIGPRNIFGKNKQESIANTVNEEEDKDSDISNENRVMLIMKEEKEKLGEIKFCEKIVLIVFSLLVLLWFFRNPGFMPGWGILFKKGYVGNATPPIIIVFLLFVIPMHYPAQTLDGNIITILNWNKVRKNFPWGVIFLLGGGFAIGHASVKTGLSRELGSKLLVLGDLPELLMIYIICFCIGILTEMTSNVAVCTMAMPIMASMSTQLGYSPLYLMLPVGVTSSLGFMLPVSNPPTALGFEYAKLSIKDMAIAGSALKFLVIIPVTLVTQYVAFYFFEFQTIPSFNNSTTAAML